MNKEELGVIRQYIKDRYINNGYYGKRSKYKVKHRRDYLWSMKFDSFISLFRIRDKEKAVCWNRSTIQTIYFKDGKIDYVLKENRFLSDLDIIDHLFFLKPAIQKQILKVCI